MNTKTAFFEHSQSIAENFLQTVIIIDDEAYTSRTTSSPSNATATSSEQAVPARGTQSLIVPISETEGGNSSISHKLNLEEVIGGFAKKKIFCSAINPQSGFDTAKHLAEVADIVVIDWALSQSEAPGDTALEILKSVFNSSSVTPDQLRLFAIYTGETDLREIAQRIKETIQPISNQEVAVEDDGFVLCYASIRIALFAKPNSLTTNAGRIVDFNQLANHLTLEFTKMTAGLVSNVAIEALACIRKNALRLINRFSGDLDAPYLTHRILQSLPQDSEDHIISLLSSELFAILDEAQVGRKAGIEMISEWVDANLPSKFPLSKEVVLNLAQDGLRGLPSKPQPPSGFGKDQIHKNFTGELVSPKLNVDLDKRFATLISLRSFYTKSRRMLTLGTIVKRTQPIEVNNRQYEYFLCLQPACDSVRLKSGKSRPFPFVPLSVTEAENETSFIVQNPLENGNMLSLKIETKPYLLQMIDFAARENETCIFGSPEDQKYLFKDTRENKYLWVAELRTEHGIRSVKNFADTISRVGVTESEWLRLLTKKKPD